MSNENLEIVLGNLQKRKLMSQEGMVLATAVVHFMREFAPQEFAGKVEDEQVAQNCIYSDLMAGKIYGVRNFLLQAKKDIECNEKSKDIQQILVQLFAFDKKWHEHYILR